MMKHTTGIVKSKTLHQGSADASVEAHWPKWGFENEEGKRLDDDCYF